MRCMAVCLPLISTLHTPPPYNINVVWIVICKGEREGLTDALILTPPLARCLPLAGLDPNPCTRAYTHTHTLHPLFLSLIPSSMVHHAEAGVEIVGRGRGGNRGGAGCGYWR
jgi:hypothetical protein